MDYQLDLVTPGRFPSDASFLKQILQIPAFLINPLGLPHKGQRLYDRTENLDFLFAFTIKAVLAKLSSLRSSIFERHPEKFQERLAFLIGFSCSHNCNIKTFNSIGLIIVNFREYDMLCDAEAVIAPSIKSLS